MIINSKPLASAKTYKKICLVVTSDQRLWPANQKILFLGKWCTTYEQREAWADRDAIMAKPFSASIDEYIVEAKKLRDLENRIVTCLSPILNQLHAKSYSKREWKIILGNWLHRYCTVFFNRYNTLHICMKNYDVSSVSFYPPNSYSLTTRTSNEFDLACNDPLWNSVLWREIWIRAGFEKHKIKFVKRPEQSFFSITEENKDTSLYRFTFKLSSLLNRSSQLMIINPYLPKKTQVILALKHLLFPQIWPKNRKVLKSKSNSELRDQLRKECAKSFTSEFETICVDLMFDVIPICYVEGFQEVQENAKKLGFPKKPAVIFTSNNFDNDEEFKSYASSQVYYGAKYIIGQHGSNYGIYIASPFNEEVVADTFITWGTHQRYLNNQPGFIFTCPYPNMMPYNKDGGILIVQLAPPFHRYHYDAFDIYQSYVDDLGAFYQKLPASIQSGITVRLPGLSAKSGSGDIERWQAIDPKIKIDNFSCSFTKAVSESRLIVFTYFSTGFLECISQDVPVVCFWKHPLETVHHDVRHIFKELMDAKILHGTHRHAAEHLLAIDGNIEEWWHSEETCKSREQFTKYFAQQSKTPVKDLSNILSSGIDL